MEKEIHSFPPLQLCQQLRQKKKKKKTWRKNLAL